MRSASRIEAGSPPAAGGTRTSVVVPEDAAAAASMAAAAASREGLAGPPPISARLLFHGSRLGRWRSILANGLLCLSNTAMMAVAAVHGAGVYLAPTASTSLGYSGDEPQPRHCHPSFILGVVLLADAPHAVGGRSDDGRICYASGGFCYTVTNDQSISLKFIILHFHDPPPPPRVV